MGPITRRAALLGLTAAIGLGRASLAVAAAGTERRFVVVNLRGALDGLAAVTPYGDPALAAVRPRVDPALAALRPRVDPALAALRPRVDPALAALRPDGAPPGPDGLLDLGGFFGLHPALSSLHGMYAAGEFLPIHAVAGPTRVRSHFEAQDCLESGADHRMTSGWLNRVAAALPSATGIEAEALAVGVTVPLLLRGPADVANWAPHGAVTLHADLYARIATLNAGDPVTGPAIVEGLRARGFSDAVLAGGDAATGQGDGRARAGFAALAEAAGRMLAAPNGPRLAALELDGWDTHSAQAQRLAGLLRQLDRGLAALKTALGEAWGQTVVLVMTEFGRTARLNGTAGTDHGTATVAFVLGGAVHGGRVVSTWPGLGAGKLLENRDLAPTTDLRSVAKGVLLEQLQFGEDDLNLIFPDSSGAAPIRGLIRT